MTRCAAPSWGAERMRMTQTPAPAPAITAAAALLALLLPAAASAQAAEWTCSFKTECLDEDCAASGYKARLALTPVSIDAGVATLQASLSDDSEAVPMAGMDQNGLMRMFNLESAAGARLLTIWPDGTARYTTHIAGPAASMTYAGRCEEAK